MTGFVVVAAIVFLAATCALVVVAYFRGADEAETSAAEIYGEQIAALRRELTDARVRATAAAMEAAKAARDARVATLRESNARRELDRLTQELGSLWASLERTSEPERDTDQDAQVEERHTPTHVSVKSEPTVDKDMSEFVAVVQAAEVM